MDGLLALTITKSPLRQDTERSLLFHALASGTENSVPLRILNNSTIWQNDANAMPDEFKVIGTRGIQTGGMFIYKYVNFFISHLFIVDLIFNLQHKRWIKMEICILF